ncbi:hypothetical protein AGMMS50256_37630 [Betaproteobacteria bacterium]|nr:hypothetical protein AGMMS50256_37630 [Betaproteobacteria bacterium]
MLLDMDNHSINNATTITGGSGGVGGGGGVGVVIYNAPPAGFFSLNISGAGTTLSGGKGGNAGGGDGSGGGGAGLVATGLSHINMSDGSINGGTGGNNLIDNVGGVGVGGGGSAVFLSVDGSSFTQSAGSITGGAGGSTTGTNPSAAGLGGDGLRANNSQISIGGTVSGGVGGASGAGVAGNGGSGIYTWSTDATTHSEITVNSTATVSGGNGGATTSGGTAGQGGVGVRLTGNNSLLINAGTIAGGTSGSGTQANAVSIEGSNNIVELHSGYSFTGNVAVASGTGNILRLGGSSNGNFDADDIGDGTNSQYIGFDAFEKNGASTWILTGTDSSAKPWTISEGILQIGDGTATGSITGNITNNANVTFNRSDTVSYGGNMTGSGSLTKDGAAGTTLTLTGNNDYSGGTTVSKGTLAGNIAPNTNLTVAANATYNGTTAPRTVNALNGAGSITNDNGLTAQSGAFDGQISGAGGLTKDGSGTLILSNTNTYLGGTTVTEGTLSIGSDDNIGGGTNTLANDSILQLTGTTYSKNWTLGTGNNNRIETAGTATMGGILSGGGFRKTGAGTLTLSGANIYTGNTNISGGTLELATASSLTSPVTVDTGATFALRGSVTGNVILNASSAALNAWQGGNITGNLTTNGGELNFYLPGAIDESVDINIYML